MKIDVKHGRLERKFKDGDIVRNRNTGLLYVLNKNVGGNTFTYHHFDVTLKRLVYNSGGAVFTVSQYELFEGTITLSNEA